MKRTAKLTIETERLFVIRSRKAARQGLCEVCGEMVSFVTADQAAAIAHTTPRAVYRMVEAERVHFIETVGDLLICLNSLCRSLLTTSTRSLTNNSSREGENHES
jgi:hypothetical protein